MFNILKLYCILTFFSQTFLTLVLLLDYVLVHDKTLKFKSKACNVLSLGRLFYIYWFDYISMYTYSFIRWYILICHPWTISYLAVWKFWQRIRRVIVIFPFWKRHQTTHPSFSCHPGTPVTCALTHLKQKIRWLTIEIWIIYFLKLNPKSIYL